MMKLLHVIPQLPSILFITNHACEDFVRNLMIVIRICFVNKAF